jgi:hypothetical protein
MSSELLQNARDNLQREMELSQEAVKQRTAKNVLDQSVLFADNVLKRLVAITVKEDVDDIFEEHVPTRGSILIDFKNTDEKQPLCEKYVLELDIVPADYMLDLGPMKDSPEVKDRMVFLLNTVKVLYCPIKDYMKARAAETNDSFNYVLQIGLNTTLFLNKDTDKRIGIVLKKVNDSPKTHS